MNLFIHWYHDIDDSTLKKSIYNFKVKSYDGNPIKFGLLLDKYIRDAMRDCTNNIYGWLIRLYNSGMRVGDPNFYLPTKTPVTYDDLYKLNIPNVQYNTRNNVRNRHNIEPDLDQDNDFSTTTLIGSEENDDDHENNMAEALNEEKTERDSWYEFLRIILSNNIK